MDHFEWDRLRIFRHVARLGSMSAAASLLGTSLPTISRRITELENELRSELFSRSTAGVSLTETGSLLLAHTDQMADAVSAIAIDLAHADDRLEGKVLMSADDAIGPYWLAPRLPHFQKDHPDIDIEFSIQNAGYDRSHFEADVAIQTARPTQIDTVTRRLGTLQYAAFATPEYLDTHPPVDSLRSLLSHRVLVHPAYRDTILNGIKPTRLLLALFESATFSNSTTATLGACSQGGGVGLLPAFLASKYEHLTAMAIPGLPPLSIWLSYTERARNLERCKAVIAWLRECFDPGTAPEFTRASNISPGSKAA